MIMKIEDVNNKNTEKRRICLHIENNPKEIIPFSRKYFTDNFDDLLDSLKVNGFLSVQENTLIKIIKKKIIEKPKPQLTPEQIRALIANSPNIQFDPETSSKFEINGH